MNHNHYMAMFFISILSGLLSTMNVWVDKVEDMQFSLNDLYMTQLMTAWMFLFMGIYYKDTKITLIGLGSVLLNIWYIRTQFMITPRQYVLGMIPHHSMAIHMSKQLLKNQPSKLTELAKNIIKTQEEEIQYMKQILNTL
jgi:hypothetical protein